MTGAEIKQGGASNLVDDDLSSQSLTGFHRRALGVWIDSNANNPDTNEVNLRFIPAGCGEYNVDMCTDGVESTFRGYRGAVTDSIDIGGVASDNDNDDNDGLNGSGGLDGSNGLDGGSGLDGGNGL